MSEETSMELEPGEDAPATNRFPVPRRTLDAEPYWHGVRERRLLFQRCQACRGAVFPPRSVCPLCEGGHPLEWADSRGRGEIYSFSTVMRPPAPVWRARAPYTLGIVHLDEDYYMFSEILGPPAAIAIGRRVRAVFPEREVLLPAFELDQP
ncbi:MAG: OB-fold domain-containing protein [Gemmatimonadales bacterium]|nr:OB-fold domain-containing protein [Gemmatimonadales bacterium]